MSSLAIVSSLFFLLTAELSTSASGQEEVDLVHDVVASALNGISGIDSATKAYFVCNAQSVGFGAAAGKATVPLDQTKLSGACRGLTLIMEGLMVRRAVKAIWQTPGKGTTDVDKFIGMYSGCTVIARTECVKKAIKENLSDADANAVLPLLKLDYFACENRIKNAFFSDEANKLCGKQDTIANVVKKLMS